MQIARERIIPSLCKRRNLNFLRRNTYLELAHPDLAVKVSLVFLYHSPSKSPPRRVRLGAFSLRKNNAPDTNARPAALNASSIFINGSQMLYKTFPLNETDRAHFCPFTLAHISLEMSTFMRANGIVHANLV